MSNVTIFWDNTTPTATDLVGQGDDQIRSLKSNLQGALDAEHVFPSTGGAAGAHRAGSARVFVGAASAISSADTDGRLMWDSTNSRLMYLSSTSTAYIGGQRAVSVATLSPPLTAGQQMVMSLVSSVVTSNGGGSVLTYGPTYTGVPYIQLSLGTTGAFSLGSSYAVTYSNPNTLACTIQVWDTKSNAVKSDASAVVVQMLTMGIQAQ